LIGAFLGPARLVSGPGLERVPFEDGADARFVDMPALLTPARDGWFGEGSLAHDPDARQSAPQGAPLDARRAVVSQMEFLPATVSG